MMDPNRSLRIILSGTLACLCAAAPLYAQNFISATDSQAAPVISSRRQLVQLTLADPAPEYPPIAKVNYLEGLVQIQITVDPTGHVAAAHVLKGNAVLANAALKAVRHWLYRPLATSAGPSGFTATVRMNFSILHPSISLSSKEAQRDFDRQVKPPRIVAPLLESLGSGPVRVRILVSDEGRVVDSDCLAEARHDATCANLRGLTFEPAHWGTLPIASYFMVEIPAGPLAESRAPQAAPGR
jgi:TonB family protein